MQQYNMSVSCWKKKKKQEEGPIIELNSEYLIVSIVYMVIDFHRTFVKFKSKGKVKQYSMYVVCIETSINFLSLSLIIIIIMQD